MKESVSLRPPPPRILWTLLLLGILSISCASIFIRLADAPPLAIAAYRVGIATVLIAPYYLRRRRRAGDRWNSRILLLTLVSGIFLALHFTFWIESLRMTSVASAATLCNTTPLFTALFCRVFLGERLPRLVIAGILVTFGGSVFLAGTDFLATREALWGDLLALSGAVMAAGYFLAGRAVRPLLSLPAYTLAVYGVAALVLLACSMFAGTALSGFSAKTYLFLALLAVIPQLIGHTTFNWVLRFLSPTIVAILILGEPVGATLLAWLILGEAVTTLKFAGLVTLGAGIVLSSLSISPRESPDPPTC
jgi:drug/metabolite transporter (DMT)-like permease